MERLSDTAIDIINKLHTERLDYTSEYLPLIDAAQSLAHYEDLEEQGRLAVLPCRPYAAIYTAEPFTDGVVREGYVTTFEIDEEKTIMWTSFDGEPLGAAFRLDEVGKTVFLSREEAEAALAENEVKGE